MAGSYFLIRTTIFDRVGQKVAECLGLGISSVSGRLENTGRLSVCRSHRQVAANNSDGLRWRKQPAVRYALVTVYYSICIQCTAECRSVLILKATFSSFLMHTGSPQQVAAYLIWPISMGAVFALRGAVKNY